MEKKIKLKLEEIVRCVLDGIENNDIKNTTGLYNGQFGILLFLYYYSIYSNNKKNIRSFTDAYAEKLVNQLYSERIPTFCSGLSGILYLFEYLREQQFIDIDMDDVEMEFNQYLIYCMEQFISVRNYDFMHGALGIGLYFLKNKKNKQTVLKLIEFLNDTANKDHKNNIYKWKSLLNEDGAIGYNISLCHGISSIVLFMSRTITNHIEHDKSSELLEGAVNYLLSQEIDNNLYGSYFPSQSLENENSYLGRSRMGWCYGDLGVAYSIYVAGKTLNRKEWIEKGMHILIDSTERKNANENYVADAGLCHGSAGIAMVYKRLFLETENQLFLETSRFWLNQTLLFSNHADGLSGYKSYRGRDKESECDYSLLSGISGIGLMYTSYLMRDKQTWDEMFLLS